MRLPRIRITLRRMMFMVAVIAGVLWLAVLDLRRSQAINTPDIIDVEITPTPSERLILDQRLVRPDGKITLGRYGEVHVAGSSLGEARAKIVLHLRRYLSDEALGLVEPVKNSEGEWVRRKVTPYETNRVSVRMNTKNSQVGFINKFTYEIRCLPSRIWN